MATLSFIFLFIVVTKLCVCQIINFGSCVDVPTVEYFELEKFLGTWYELERYPVWYEELGLCAYKNIKACGRHVEIEHVYVRDHIQYVLQINTTYAPGDDAVFEIQQSNVDKIGIPLRIVSTDYTNYAVMYGCKYFDEINIKYLSAWILARNSTLAADYLDIAYDVLNKIPSLSTAYLESVDHSEASCDHSWTAHVLAVNDENNEDDDD